MGKTALVLAGGGSRGAYQVGVWQAMLELGMEADIIVGTSVGALNGAMIAQGSFEDAVAVWSDLETTNVVDIEMQEDLSVRKKACRTVFHYVRDGLKQRRIGLDTTPLRRLVRQHLDEERVRASGKELGIVTVDLKQRRTVRLFLPDIAEGELADYILASTACFPALQTYDIGGVKYVDGGYADNLPVEMALGRGADFVIAVDLDVGFVNQEKRVRDLDNVLYLKSYWNLGPMLVFDKAMSRRNMRLGYLDGMKALGVFDGVAYALQKEPCAEEERRQVCALLAGGDSAAARLAQTLLEKHIETKFQGKYHYESDLCPACMETAGELFGLDPEQVYSAGQFRAQVGQAAGAVRLPSALKVGEKAGLSPEKLKESLAVFDKTVRAALLAQWMQKGLEDKSALLPPLCGIMPDEAMAAAYLCAIGAVQ